MSQVTLVDPEKAPLALSDGLKAKEIDVEHERSRATPPAAAKFAPSERRHHTGQKIGPKPPLKVVIVGDQGVGKSSLVAGGREHEHDDHVSGSNSPVPGDMEIYGFHTCSGQRSRYKLAVLSTRADEHYDRLRLLAYPRTDVFIIAFDVRDHASLNNIQSRWYPELYHHGPRVPIVVVGLVHERGREEKGVGSYGGSRLSAGGLQGATVNRVSDVEVETMLRPVGAADYVEIRVGERPGMEELADKVVACAMAPTKRHVGAKSQRPVHPGRLFGIFALLPLVPVFWATEKVKGAVHALRKSKRSQRESEGRGHLKRG